MDVLLIVAIVIGTLSIVIQTGILVAMYLTSREIIEKVNLFIELTEKLFLRINNLADGAETELHRVTAPIRQGRAVLAGVSEGLRALFSKKTKPDADETENRAA